jgi:hypothetical protein
LLWTRTWAPMRVLMAELMLHLPVSPSLSIVRGTMLIRRTSQSTS